MDNEEILAKANEDLRKELISYKKLVASLERELMIREFSNRLRAYYLSFWEDPFWCILPWLANFLLGYYFGKK